MDTSRNHFQLFGLPQGFDLDLAALDAAYRAMQGEIHPDRFASASDAEQRQAVQWAAEANEAYKTLKSPFERARYLLMLQGIDALDANNTVMPPAFLIQQMEWREQLAEAVAAQDPDGLSALETAIRKQSRVLLAEMAELLDLRSDYLAASEAVRKYRFMEKLLADIHEAFDDIE